MALLTLKVEDPCIRSYEIKRLLDKRLLFFVDVVDNVD